MSMYYCVKYANIAMLRKCQTERQVLGLFRSSKDAAGPVPASASALLIVGTVRPPHFIRRIKSPRRVVMLASMIRREFVRVSCGISSLDALISPRPCS